jgi:predicted GNAT superfamily acetyltransferase
MTSPIFTPLTEAHYDDVLRLNADFVHWTAPMDAAELLFILRHSDYAQVVLKTDGSDGLSGLLLGYDHDTNYPDHKNLIWIREHLENFFYIDRIIIDSSAQGQGLGHAFYQDVAAFARARGHKYLACEVNTRPDNPSSHAFHRHFGFKSLGEREFNDLDKAVRYYALKL